MIQFPYQGSWPMFQSSNNVFFKNERQNAAFSISVFEFFFCLGNKDVQYKNAICFILKNLETKQSFFKDNFFY